jgi:hypothetical protein
MNRDDIQMIIVGVLTFVFAYFLVKMANKVTGDNDDEQDFQI